MSAEENEYLVRQYFERLNRGDLDAIDELIGDSPIEHWGVTDVGGMLEQLGLPMPS